MKRILEWLVPLALAGSPWVVNAQAAPANSSSLSTTIGNLSMVPPLQSTIIPGIDVFSPTLGSEAATLPTIGAPAIGAPLLPTIGTPGVGVIGPAFTPSIGTPTLPTIGTSTAPTIGTPTLPTIGTPTAPTIGTPTLPTIGTPTPPTIGIPMPGIGLQPMPPIGPSTSVIGGGTIGAPTQIVGSTSGTASGTGRSGSGPGFGPDLSCLPEDFFCGGVVRP